jgi:hypothetical protein
LSGSLFPHQPKVVFRVLVAILGLDRVATQCRGMGKGEVAFVASFGIGKVIAARQVWIGIRLHRAAGNGATPSATSTGIHSSLRSIHHGYSFKNAIDVGILLARPTFSTVRRGTYRIF